MEVDFGHAATLPFGPSAGLPQPEVVQHLDTRHHDSRNNATLKIRTANKSDHNSNFHFSDTINEVFNENLEKLMSPLFDPKCVKSQFLCQTEV